MPMTQLSPCCGAPLVDTTLVDPYCLTCGRRFTTADLLAAMGIPTKPQPTAPPMGPHTGKLSPCCQKPYVVYSHFAHDEYGCSQCSLLYTEFQVMHYSVWQVKAAAPTYPIPPPNTSTTSWKDVKIPPGRRPLTGNTYPVRDQLCKLGGYWNPEARVWLIPEKRYDEAVEIVRRGPNPETTPPTPFFYGTVRDQPAVHHSCWECGTSFTEADATRAQGSFAQYWCGCTERFPKALKAAPPAERQGYYTPVTYTVFGTPNSTYVACKWCGGELLEHADDGGCLFDQV